MNGGGAGVPTLTCCLLCLSLRQMSLVDLGKRLLEAARKGQDDEVRNLMANGAPFTTDWVRWKNQFMIHLFLCDLIMNQKQYVSPVVGDVPPPPGRSARSLLHCRRPAQSRRQQGRPHQSGQDAAAHGRRRGTHHHRGAAGSSKKSSDESGFNLNLLPR